MTKHTLSRSPKCGVAAGLLVLLGVGACGSSGSSKGSSADSVAGSGAAGSSSVAGAPSASGASGVAGGSGEGGSGASGVAGGSGMPAGAVFSEGQVLEFEFEVAPDDWTRLEEHGDEEVYYPAAATVRGSGLSALGLASVGLRHKGAWTLHHCWDDFGGVRSYAGDCSKLSYKVKFDEYDDAARFEGLKRLNLHAVSGDATKMRELLAYAAFNDFGVDAPRTVPARVTINGELQGLFIAVEEIDGRYTDSHFPGRGDGNLYKEAWPRSGVPEEAFVEHLETNEEPPDVSDMLAFGNAVDSATEETFAGAMASWVSLEQILRYVAVDRALKNWDGIMAFYSPTSPHNFFWYHDDGDEGRFHLIPWDLDNTFWEFDPVMSPEQWVTAQAVPDWNVAPASCDEVPIWDPGSSTMVTPPGCDPFLGLLAKTEWHRFTEIAEELLAGPIAYEALDAKVGHWESLLEPLVSEDPHLDVDTWHSEVEYLRQILRDVAPDFERFVARGYTVQEPEEALPEPPPEEFEAASEAHGLVLDGVNNFEFTDGALGVTPPDAYAYGDEAVTFDVYWNTEVPVAGSADLRFDFDFQNIPGDPWNEWVLVALATDDEAEVDIRGVTQISVTIRADSERSVRIRVSSPAYDDVFAGAWREFGMDVSAGPEARTIKLRLDRLSYPDWAREAWTEGQGWTTDDAEARETVLSRFDGLLFGPSPHTDDAGELLGDSDLGYLQIDDVYFQ